MQTTASDTRQTALVVDYDPWERWFTTEVLTEQGYAVLGASNGVSGLRLAEQHPCDVILLDLALPELPGAELLRQLKASDTTREIPVILLGASRESPTYLAEGCVPRPLEDVRVTSEVGRVLARQLGPRGEHAGRPFVLVASADAELADRLVEHVRRNGSVACAARSEAGCLRVATAVGPDVVLLDSRLPSRLEGLLRAHPVSGAANIVRLPTHVDAHWTL
jgi:CheY-like chemotaxis protein